MSKGFIPPGQSRFASASRDVAGIKLPSHLDIPNITPTKTWVCQKGHELISPQPFSIPIMKISPIQTLSTGAVCPVCLAEFYSVNFQMWEKGTDRPELASIGDDGEIEILSRNDTPVSPEEILARVNPS